MQTLPYVVVTNPHISQVYELYYKAFESLRRVREIKTLEDNEKFCKKISETLHEHLTVIPKLAMGVLECRDLMKPEDMDKFMNTILRSVRSLLMSSTNPQPSSQIALTNRPPAYLPPSNSRATPRPDRNLLQPLALLPIHILFPREPFLLPRNRRIRRRSLPKMQRRRNNIPLLQHHHLPLNPNLPLHRPPNSPPNRSSLSHIPLHPLPPRIYNRRAPAKQHPSHRRAPKRLSPSQRLGSSTSPTN
jgi:hypothetical protein